MIGAARLAAYNVLRDVGAHRDDLPGALARHRAAIADPRDRTLLAEIAMGTLRWRARLDHVIAHAAGRPIARLDEEVLTILRLSAYQLAFLDRVPPRAVIADAVDLARHARVRSAAGFVNAVLRRLSRTAAPDVVPPRPKVIGTPPSGSADETAALDYLSITLSHPRWLARRWLRRFGFEPVEAWATFNNRPAPLTLRANTLRISRDELASHLAALDIGTMPGRFAPDALIVVSGHPLASPVSTAGLFLVQDEASQLVATAAGARSGDQILDACAAPGGKTVALWAGVGATGQVVAADRRARRLALLKTTLDGCGAPRRIVQLDLRHALPFGPVFDMVLVDAPCSGLGTLRRDPDLRWRRQEPDLDRFAGAQLRMLHQAATGVRPGGRLVYATCSSEPEENEAVVARFLREANGFSGIDLRTESPGRLPPAILDASGRLRTLPHVHGLEAFFTAVLQRSKHRAGMA